MPYMPPKPPVKKDGRASRNASTKKRVADTAAYVGKAIPRPGSKTSAYPPKSKPVSRAALPATPKRSTEMATKSMKKSLPKTK